MWDFFAAGEFEKKNLYEMVADELEKSILQSPEMLGERLPAEQAIADQFGVSRNIVREAFKILKERGLLSIKDGDGSYVTKPQAELFTQQIRRMVSFSQTDLEDLYQIRAMFEREAAGLVAEKITREETAALEELADQMRDAIGDPHRYVRCDLEFHCQLVKAAGNEMLYALYQPIAGALGVMIPFGSEAEELRRGGVAQHQDIVRAIQSREREAIMDAVQNHIRDARRDLLEILRETRRNAMKTEGSQ